MGDVFSFGPDDKDLIELVVRLARDLLGHLSGTTQHNPLNT
jgi:hypothetical protein